MTDAVIALKCLRNSVTLLFFPDEFAVLTSSFAMVLCLFFVFFFSSLPVAIELSDPFHDGLVLMTTRAVLCRDIKKCLFVHVIADVLSCVSWALTLLYVNACVLDHSHTAQLLIALALKFCPVPVIAVCCGDFPVCFQLQSNSANTLN